MSVRRRSKTIDLAGVQGIVLRRNPDRLGGAVTVVMLIADKEVELIRDAGDLIDHCIWPTGIAQRLKTEGIVHG